VSARIGSGKIAGEKLGQAQAREEVVHDWKGADGIGGKREVVGILHRLDTSQ
jgi:hypothetical protein